MFSRSNFLTSDTHDPPVHSGSNTRSVGAALRGRPRAGTDIRYNTRTMVTKRPAKPKTTSRRPQTKQLNVWERIIELGNTIPDDEIARMPRDGAKNFDHYLHGSPKQS